MKKFILALVLTVVTSVANNAQADELSSTTRYVLDTVQNLSVANARSCAQAYHHGGTYRHMDTRMTLTCTKHTIHKEWDPSKN